MISYKSVTEKQYGEYFQLLLNYMSDYIDTILPLMEMTVDEFAERFRSVGQVYCIVTDGKEAGFYWVEERGRKLHLHGIIITEQFQGRGIGTATLKMLENRYKNTKDYIELGVYQENTKAIRLYKRLGYKIASSMDQLGFHIMRKGLSSGV